MTGKVAPYKTGFGPFPHEVFHALFPCEVHGVSVNNALQSVERLLKTDVEPNRVAAFVLEPVQGEGGFHVAPPAFVAGLKEIADRHGILLIADEVQTGAGRTGTWFASEQWPVAPDPLPPPSPWPAACRSRPWWGARR
jgi:4-aminobutyrate aminotransferase/(S)-3-amino-2-methylpropionate transaminase